MAGHGHVCSKRFKENEGPDYTIYIPEVQEAAVQVKSQQRDQ